MATRRGVRRRGVQQRGGEAAEVLTGPLAVAVLLTRRNSPPPKDAGATFQKPAERLLLEYISCICLLSARMRHVGTETPDSLQFGQNLFLKWALPHSKPMVWSASWQISAPQQDMCAQASPK